MGKEFDDEKNELLDDCERVEETQRHLRFGKSLKLDDKYETDVRESMLKCVKPMLVAVGSEVKHIIFYLL